jgi:flagellin
MLLDGTASAITFQVGINATSQDRLTVGIDDMHADQLGGTSVLSNQSISTVAGAQNSLAVIDQAITDISASRGELGAVQNRLNVTIANLGSARENLSAANSRIRDVDVAAETALMTRNSILMQAGVSVLAQANQIPSMALSLLQ